MHADRAGAVPAWTFPADVAPASRFDVVVIGREAREADTRTAALHALNARVSREYSLGADLAGLADHAGRPVLILDLVAATDVSADLLARLDQLAASRDWPLVIAFPFALLDLVAATCIDAI